MSRRMPKRTTVMNWAFCLGVASFLSTATATYAQPALNDAKAQGMLRTAVAALQRNDHVQAQRSIELCYQREANPALFEMMGQIAEQADATFAAADLYRRFLEEQPALLESRRPLVEFIEKVQTRAAEVAVGGEPGSLLRVDGRLVGRLPLSHALLLSPGKHRLSLERGGRTVSYPLEATAGVPVGLRFVPDSAHVAIETRPPILLVTYDGLARPVQAEPGTSRAILAGIRQDGQAYDLPAQRLLTEASKRQGDCLMADACLTSLAQRFGAQGVILFTGGAAPRLGYFDTRLGRRTDQVEASCLNCSVEQRVQHLQRLTQQLISRTIGRAYGMLDIRVQPPGAQVLIGEAASPLPVPAVVPSQSGATTLLLRKDGFLPLRTQVEVPTEGTQTIELLLRPNRAAQVRRKVAIGKSLLISAGTLGVVGGVIGIALDGRITRSNPDEVFTSLTQGAVFLGLGVTAVCGGIGLAVHERKLAKQAAADEAAALSNSSLP